MECREVLENVVDRLSGELSANRSAELDQHLASCERCRGEVKAWEETWQGLGEDPEAVPTRDFRRNTLQMMEDATLRRRVKAFRPRLFSSNVGQIAAMLVCGFIGFSIARGTGQPGRTNGPGGPVTEPAMAPNYVVEPEKTLDMSTTRADLTRKPKLANVAYKPADASGKIGVSFDVTTRYNLVGRPEDKGIAEVLAYLVTGAGETDGARSKAIEVVSQHYSEGTQPAPGVVKVLVETLRSDKNPGVRKKAAEMLAQIPPTPETRDALVQALKTDTNPAVRMLAVEGLAKAATQLHDPATIETLRSKATDTAENGYVRGQAAAALRKIQP